MLGVNTQSEQQAFPYAWDGKRQRVLVVAYTMSPIRGSEPAGAWNVVKRLAQFHDVTLITCPECEGQDYRRETIEYLKTHPVPGLVIQYVAPPFLARKLMRPAVTIGRTLYYLGYSSWQRAAFKIARSLHAVRPFDVLHQLNMTGFREPGYLWQLNAPFVWGPIAGACNMPWSCLRLMPLSEATFYGLRNIVNSVQRYTAIRCWFAARRAARIWYVGRDEENLVRKIWRRDNGEVMLDSGTSPVTRPSCNYDGKRPLRLVWSGVHIGRKGLPILLHALASMRTAQIEVTVLGEGPQTEAWDTLAGKLGVRHMIRWMGKLPYPAAMAEMGRADALVFTSLMEAASHVVLEALSMGLPVVCHDACGMSLAVDDTSGIKVPLKNVETSVKGFSAAIRTLLTDPVELRRLTAGAARRGTELTWDAKVAQICEAYDQIAKQRVVNESSIAPAMKEASLAR